MNGHKKETQRREFDKLSLNLLKLSSDKDNINTMLDDIEMFVKNNGTYVSTSQIRNIYDVIIKYDDDNYNNAKLIRPKIIYAAAKQEKEKEKNFIVQLHDLLKAVNDPKEFKSYKMVFEAIVAYHKNYSRKN